MLLHVRQRVVFLWTELFLSLPKISIGMFRRMVPLKRGSWLILLGLMLKFLILIRVFCKYKDRLQSVSCIMLLMEKLVRRWVISNQDTLISVGKTFTYHELDLQMNWVLRFILMVQTQTILLFGTVLWRLANHMVWNSLQRVR